MNTHPRYLARLWCHLGRTLVVTCSVAILAGAGYGAGAGAAAANDYYAGKTITVYSSRSAGSGVTLLTRALAENLGENIGGNPAVVVKPLTGAGGNRALNFLYAKAPKDGTQIMYTPWGGIGQAVGLEGIRFKYEEFTSLGGASLAGELAWVRKDAAPGGMKNPKDIAKAGNLKYAGSSILSTRHLAANLMADLLGLKYTFVSGYRGNAKIRAAVLSGEVNMTTDGIHIYRMLIRKNMQDKDFPVWHVPIRKADGTFGANPQLKEFAPSFIDLYKSVHGRAPSGKVWEAAKLAIHLGTTVSFLIIGPPGMNPEATAVLRPAIAKTLNSKKFIAATEKRFLYALNPKTHQEVSETMKVPSTASPEMITFFKDYFEKKGQRAKKKK